MDNLLTLHYWFNLRPETLLPYAQNLFISFIIFLAVIAIIATMTKKAAGVYRGLLKKIYAYGITNALIGLILLFLNYESVPFFSARFWLGLWILIMAIWLVFIIKRLLAIPKQKKQLAKEKEFKKYIP